MAVEETNITNAVMMFAARNGCTLFKNVRGLFFTLDKKRRVRAGLCVNGSSDLIGFTRVKITADMVGRTVAIFTAVEIKTAKGKVSIEQRDFVDYVAEHGGIAGIARNEDDAKKLLDGDK